MLSVTTPSLEDIVEIVKKYNLRMDINMEIPTMLFPFFSDDKMVGFGKVTIVDNVARLEEFVVDEEDRQRFGLFFLKGVGSKIADHGFESFVAVANCDDLYEHEDNGEIVLEKLFVGECQK